MASISPLNDADRWAVLVAHRADFSGGLSFTKALRQVRKAENALADQGAFDEVPDSRLEWRVLLAEKVKQVHASGG